MFRVFSNALTDVILTGNAPADAAAVLAAITAGHVYSTIDAAGGTAAMSFTAESGGARAAMGDLLPVAGPVTLRVRVQAPPDARIDVVRNGSVMEARTGASLELTDTAPAAVYRVEVSLPGGPGEPPIPWMVSNPIYTGRAEETPARADTPARATTFITKYGDGPATGWEVETSPAALGAIDVIKLARGTQLSLRYALGGAASANPYAAFVMPAGTELAAYDRLTFVARANAPMRLSVQLREPGTGPGERWHRSVHIDPEPREISVYFNDLRPRGASRSRPALSNVQAILFVVDTVNTALGGNGTIWIDEVRYGR
jgi:hypothetical protein